MARYLIALGSNMRHHRHGAPPDVLRAALAAMEGVGLRIVRSAPIIATAPLGPSLRTFANSVTLVETTVAPESVLDMLKAIERDFGRKSGRRWGQRVLDCDIILWSEGPFDAPGLVIPHPLFRERSFVTAPASAVAPDWRDPLTGLTLRQLHARLTRPRPIPRGTA